MKNSYEKPELRIVKLEIEDVIAASSDNNNNNPRVGNDPWEILFDI